MTLENDNSFQERDNFDHSDNFDNFCHNDDFRDQNRGYQENFHYHDNIDNNGGYYHDDDFGCQGWDQQNYHDDDYYDNFIPEGDFEEGFENPYGYGGPNHYDFGPDYYY